MNRPLLKTRFDLGLVIPQTGSPSQPGGAIPRNTFHDLVWTREGALFSARLAARLLGRCAPSLNRRCGEKRVCFDP